MARDRDQDAAASATAPADADADADSQIQDPDHAQSKRPPFAHHRSDDSHSDTSALHSQQPPHHQPQQHRSKTKHHHVARAHHGRVPSSKTLYKAQAAQAARPPHKRGTSSPDVVPTTTRHPSSGPNAHRRATSEVKLPRQQSATSLIKSPSHTSLKRNRSHVEITRRNKSSDKLKRTASGTAISPHKATKSQVHFDLGDDPEDEWVDASESNSPYLSRKGSIVSSAGQSRHEGGGTTSESRPVTPNEQNSVQDPAPAPPPMSSPDRERVNHKAYLTSRLLQRTPSQGAPPQMTPDLAQGAPSSQASPGSTSERGAPPTPASNKDGGVTSRFVDGPSSGLGHSGSFFHAAQAADRRQEEILRGTRSAVNLSRSHEENRRATPTIELDDSALAPRQARRSRAPPAETSRIQQKLNLQRASSVIEPGQTAGIGGVPGMNPLIGITAPSYDGGQSRDPRLSKLLERTGMEYLVVRRYQNPIARSLNRLAKNPETQGFRRVPRVNTGASTASSKKSLELPMRQHARNVSMPESRRPATPNTANPKRPGTASTRASGPGDEQAAGAVNGRLSGSSLIGVEGGGEDGVTTALRNMWEKSLDLSASTD